ncbi:MULTISPECIES: hypothetical protein [Pseudoalteromonas]|uniref:Uncharacterized protein n=1 Tax=Pseudoalteromonas amylolytica TaxID=1859457 RepID=A0A1S1N0L6_9GAMM|nr:MULTISPECIES: hypothetical protein [Pseudoalteromonas]OHU91857.1 hypothetical protein BFC16_02530 [Pseudoalteromonas sp. JW3]OHU93183.1 hypothetical protein BET10_02440 [Pseudoalteromonas amylolytica]
MDSNFVVGKHLLVGTNSHNQQTLKRDLLLFDGFVDLEYGSEYPSLCKAVLGQMESQLGEIRDTVKYPFLTSMLSFSELCSIGLVKSFEELGLESQVLNFEAAINIADRLPSKGIKKFSFCEAFDIKARPDREVENEMIYFASEKLREQGSVATPRLREMPCTSINHKSLVTQVVLEKFPLPDEGISINRILDFKADNDSVRRLGSLNVLINRLVREQANPSDVRQEIEQLILEAKSVMQAKKFAYKESKLTKAVRVIESVIKGNLGELFKIRDQEKAENAIAKELNVTHEEIALMQLETASEWKHVAYILHAESIVK